LGQSEAAARLERIAATVPEIEPALLEAYEELFEDDDEDGVVAAHVNGELLGQIGFGWEPETASEFVSKFIAMRTGTIAQQ
jgi:hypothetical protein